VCSGWSEGEVGRVERLDRFDRFHRFNRFYKIIKFKGSDMLDAGINISDPFKLRATQVLTYGTYGTY
jgi:hypothetical protein